MRFLVWLVTFIVVFSLSSMPHAEVTKPDAEPNRPRVGLVLGGGGAKGAAHVGVLRVLHEMNIPVDIVVGASIGSVVGGLYAIGYDVDTIEEKMLGADFNEGYSDAIPREHLSFRNKQLRDQFNIPAHVGFSDRQIKIPSGLLQGQSMNRLIRDLSGLVPSFQTFDHLALPYRAVATDIATRDRVVIGKGSVGLAMRASSSVPGILAPVEYDGKLLVDGGVIDNLPIDVARKMGADIVIAVDIGDGLKGRDELDSTIAVASQLTAFLTSEGRERSILSLRANDVYVRPKINGMATTDFSVMPAALAAGKASAIKVADQLKALAVSQEQYSAYLSGRAHALRRIHRQSLLVSGTVMNNDSDVHPDYIQSQFELLAGDLVNIENVQKAIGRVYASDEFQHVDLTIEPNDDDQDHLRLWTDRKSWGPHYVWLGVAWEEDLTQDSYVDFDVAYIMRDLSRYGAEWRNQLELGDDSLMFSEFYAPLVATRWSYSRVRYAFQTEVWDDVFNDFSFVTFTKRSHIGELGLGLNITKDSFIEIGWSAEAGEIENELSSSDFLYDANGPYLKFGYDSLDSLSFPTRGNRLVVSFFLRDEDVDGTITSTADSIDGTYQSKAVDVQWKGAVSIGENTLVGKTEWAEVSSDVDVSAYFAQLGGFLNLSGFERNALNGAKKGFGALIYQWNVGKDLFRLSQIPVFVGFSYEVGNVWSSSEEMALSDAIHAGSIFLGTDTRLGPVALAYGTNELDQNSAYFYLGKDF